MLVGGLGADVLLGGAGEDILLGGTFMGASSTTARRARVEALMTQWLAATPYATRVASLDGFMSTRVGADASRDFLMGESGWDWFFATLAGSFRDSLPDRLGRELVRFS